MITTYLPIAVTLAGLALYLLSDKPKAMEVGRIMMFAGLLACLIGK